MEELSFCRAGLVDTKLPIGCGQGMHYGPQSPREPPTHGGRSVLGAAAEKAAGGHFPPLGRRSEPADRVPPAPLTCAPSAGPSGRSRGKTPFRIGRTRNPGAGVRGRTLLGIGYSDRRTCGPRSWFAGGSGWAEGGSLPWVPCQSLAPCGFLGDVAPPPAQASFRLGWRPWAFARDRAERCRGAAGPWTRECECWRAAGPRGTGSEAGTPTPPPGGCRFLQDTAGPRARPAPREPGRVRRAPEPERTCLEWVLGEWVGAWPPPGGLVSWALLEVSLKPIQLSPGCRLRRCLGQGDRLLRAKGKGGDRRWDH